MAIRSKITAIKSEAELQKLGYKPSSTEFKDLIKELIRLDIPILEVGSSSIGKSFSLRTFMDECGIRGAFLFVGTEKAEFIEGIPNLRGISEGQAKFSYLQPYWFPNKDEIKNRLALGLDNLEISTGEIKKLWDASKINYGSIESLKKELFKIKRSEEELRLAKEKNVVIGKYVYENSLLYLSTLQGYGNFWLILDEIDKVEPQDKDKYAPLLHIVRERELKGWKLSGLRDWPEYDIKYVQTIDQRIERLNAAIKNPDVDVTDTRVIAIANDLQDFQNASPALYRRFVKLVINNTLYDEKQAKNLPDGSAIGVGYDWSKAYDVKKNDLHSCIIKHIITKDGKKVSISDDMAAIEADKLGDNLNEMNLQWTLGFLPEMLFPGVDTRQQAKNLGVPNMLIENFNDNDDPFKTLIYKIIQDNFVTSYWISMLECIYDQISPKAIDKSKESSVDYQADRLYEMGGITQGTIDTPDEAKIGLMLDEYQNALVSMEMQFAEQVELQKKQMAGTLPKKVTISTVEAATYNVALDMIKIGNKLVLNSLKDGKEISKTTELIMSSVPFMQNRMISSSPNIPHKTAEDLMERINDTAIELMHKITGKKLDDATAKEMAENTFKQIKPSRALILKFGAGIEPEDINDISSLKPGPQDKPKRESILNRVLSRRPVLTDQKLLNSLVQDEDLKKKYYESIAPAKMIEKEIYGNLAGIFNMIIETYEKEGLSDDLKSDLFYYCSYFPGKMKNIVLTSRGSGQPVELLDYIDKECDKAFGTTQKEIDSVNTIEPMRVQTA